MRTSSNAFLLALAAAMLLLCACQKRPSTTAATPTIIPQEFRVGVAWFTQPTSTRELITGQLPEHQGKIPSGLLAELDAVFARALSQHSNRQYLTLQAPDYRVSMEYRETGSPQGLKTWLDIARRADMDLLIVPQVIDWNERDGGEVGTSRAASVKVEFSLIDTTRNRLLKRSVFEERQVGLADNLLTVGKFFQRRGRWVNAEQLAAEGMVQAIREFGL